MPSASSTIHAAGGVLWRNEGGALHCAVIHRPKYDDWTLPKGKLDPGETHEQAALREVREETGWRAEVGLDLGEINYEHNGRPKAVQYWAMHALQGRFEPNDEVDDLRWAEPDHARALLTYDRDREVLDRFLAADVAR